MEIMINSGFVHDTTKLRKLIAENPDLPIVVLAGEYAWSGEYEYEYGYGYGYEYCSNVHCDIEWILDCEVPFEHEYVLTDKDRFEECLGNYLFGLSEWKILSDEEFDKRLKEELEKYKPYWKKVIAIYADN